MAKICSGIKEAQQQDNTSYRLQEYSEKPFKFCFATCVDTFIRRADCSKYNEPLQTPILKMNKTITLTFCLLAILLPVMGFAQTDGDYSNLLQFLKGDGAFEKWFMEVFTKLDNSVQDSAAGSALVGKAIGGLGALMYLGYMGWQMAAGDREWEITPMLKPILIGFTLVYWSGFVSMIQAPFEAIAEPGISIFSEIESEVNDLRVERFKKQQQLLDAVIKLKAEEDAKQEVIENTTEDADDSWFDISEGLDKLIQPIKEWSIRMEFQMQKLVAELIEFCCLSILRICVYLIFFIQKIWSYILIILGTDSCWNGSYSRI